MARIALVYPRSVIFVNQDKRTHPDFGAKRDYAGEQRTNCHRPQNATADLSGRRLPTEA